MKTVFLFATAILLLINISSAAQSESPCMEARGVCVGKCAIDRSPERCMQGCQVTARRCSVQMGEWTAREPNQAAEKPKKARAN